MRTINAYTNLKKFVVWLEKEGKLRNDIRLIEKRVLHSSDDKEEAIREGQRIARKRGLGFETEFGGKTKVYWKGRSPWKTEKISSWAWAASPKVKDG